METVFLVMATASGFRCSERQPLPLKVFNDHSSAEERLDVLLDYHISPPSQYDVEDDEAGWKAYLIEVEAWRVAHPAGRIASDYQHFGIYEVPIVLREP